MSLTDSHHKEGSNLITKDDIKFVPDFSRSDQQHSTGSHVIFNSLVRVVRIDRFVLTSSLVCREEIRTNNC